LGFTPVFAEITWLFPAAPMFHARKIPAPCLVLLQSYPQPARVGKRSASTLPRAPGIASPHNPHGSACMVLNSNFFSAVP
jgi:hypothetical protein